MIHDKVLSNKVIKLIKSLNKKQYKSLINCLKKIGTVDKIDKSSQMPTSLIDKLMTIDYSTITEKDIDVYNKDFANWTLKFGLLCAAKDYLTQNNMQVNTLLDLASGKGNDLNRWTILNFNSVIGIDIDPSQHREAIKRYKNTRSPKPKVQYILGSASDYNLVRSSVRWSKVNLISNNFAMNYFFKNQPTINEFFRGVSDSLNIGGLFIGCATDGSVIDALLQNRQKIDEKLIYIERGLEPMSYKFKIETPFFKDVITEYIIYKSDLINYAHKYNLEPISIIEGVPAIFNFTEYKIPQCVLDSYKNNVIKSRPIDVFNTHIGLSSLYFGFSFIKIMT